MSLDVIAAPSPNFNDRKLPISLIVLHYTGMETGQVALERMCDPKAEVSAHFMVEEDGRVFQLVADEKRAWHAGVSYWHGERDINSASIGVEIVNGGHDFGLPDYPAQQVAAVCLLVGELMRRHRLKPHQVIGHSDIAVDRKEDPGEHFPWNVLAGRGLAVQLRGQEASAALATDLERAGYDPAANQEDIIRAFQRRHRPSQVDGQVDGETSALIAAAAKIYGGK